MVFGIMIPLLKMIEHPKELYITIFIELEIKTE